MTARRTQHPNIPPEVRSAVVAAQRLAAALAAEGEELAPPERVVITRALHHNIEVVGRAISTWITGPDSIVESPPAADAGVWRSDRS